MELTAEESAGMLVSGRIGAVKVWILTAHEAALPVVCMQESGGQLVPCVSHDSLNGSFGVGVFWLQWPPEGSPAWLPAMPVYAQR